MSNANAGELLRSDLRYHSYALMLGALDAEWTRRQAQEACSARESVERQVWELCSKYRRDVEQNRKAFEETLPEPRRLVRRMEPYLFDPIFYVPLSHADLLAMVLLDDFDPLQYFAAHMSTTVEDVGLAFCPKVRSLGLPKDQDLFVDLHRIWGRGVAYPDRHQLLKTYPLLVFTRYKLDAMGSMGFGLLFQQAVFKAIAEKATDVRRHLGTEFPTEKPDQLMRLSDIEAMKIAVLDLQGAEELGTLIFCRNYATAMTVVSSLRSLTYAEVVKADPRLGVTMNASTTHRRVLQLGTGEKDIASVADRIRANHVFRWTNTMLAVAPDALHRPQESACVGVIEAMGWVRLSPGHHDRVEERMTKMPIPPKSTKPVPDRETTPCYRYHVGVADLVTPCAVDPAAAKLPWMPIDSALHMIRSYWETFGTEKLENRHGRDVVDITMSITIPVPRLRWQTPDSTTTSTGGHVDEKVHCPPFLRLLPELQKRLCRPSEIAEVDRKDLGSSPGRLDLALLKKVPRLYGVPLHLRRTIEYLYQDFASLLADPHHFDTVLGLYDAFATLHAVLTEHLPRARAEELGHEIKERGYTAGRLPPLDSKRTSDLSLIVDALHNALTHRISKAYPESQVREMAIDFRGGLSQVVLASDAPLMCGLGLLRKYVFQWGSRIPARDQIGGLTKISFRPGARAWGLAMGVEDVARLMWVEADVPHVLHVPSYADYIHECAHFVLQELQRARVDPCEKGLMWEYIRDAFWPRRCEIAAEDRRKMQKVIDEMASTAEHQLPVELASLIQEALDAAIYRSGRKLAQQYAVLREERLKEVFAGLVTHVFLFGDDTDTFLRHNIITYAKTRTCQSGDPEEQVRHFAELVVRLFVIVDAIPINRHRSLWPSLCWPWKDVTKASASRRLSEMIEELGPLLPDYDIDWEPAESSGRHWCQMLLDEIHPDIQATMRQMWHAVMVIFGQFFRDGLQVGGRHHSDWQVEIAPVVEWALSRGTPLIRMLCPTKEGEQDPDKGAMDALTLTCAVLHANLAQLKQSKDKEIYLHRDKADGSVGYPAPPKGREWHQFQIDNGAAAMFCPVPSARRLRLRREIAMIKTFWDISSNFRMRRLGEMLSDNWKLNGTN